MESELDLLREENARLMAKITGLKFEKAELEARNAKLIERVAKLEEKQLESVNHLLQNGLNNPIRAFKSSKAPGETLQLRVIVSVTTDETGVRMKNNEYSRAFRDKILIRDQSKRNQVEGETV
ncbi:hypothetical protein GLOIN_2v1469756 [Rhizophagus irregularis DAOM 181602=DAOM 197198]|nr:hypothetical protein GLOIN_2v1469756 [Rhizophagus irregularis DAOM 181602=DAOM 197198]